MEIRFINEDNRATIKLSGEFGYADAFPFFAVAEKALHAKARDGIVVDLEGVNYIDSSGIGKLIHLSKQAQASGQKLSLINLQPTVRSVFSTMKLDRLLNIGG
jgi:stage II sporulation protein AA (anti-sigma F factor antagonist)